MALDRFDFPFHAVTHTYQANSDTVQFGSNWKFTASPQAAPLRIFTLKFSGLQWFLNGSNVPDATLTPQRNILTLENFYRAHQLWVKFIYPHPAFNDLNTQFSKPFQMPFSLKGGGGVVEDFTIELAEMGQ